MVPIDNCFMVASVNERTARIVDVEGRKLSFELPRCLLPNGANGVYRKLKIYIEPVVEAESLDDKVADLQNDIAAFFSSNSPPIQ